jgi:mRNA-degrading endonuclease RelE of RelBE toxin-antitoxin system
LRVGTYRIIYIVEDKTVKVLEVFKRGKGYENV